MGVWSQSPAPSVARQRLLMSARAYARSLASRHTHAQHEGQCWQCGTSHINLWGHWSSPKTPCQPPPESDDDVSASQDKAKADVPVLAKKEHDHLVASLVDMGVPEAKAVAALECSNFNLIEALTYLEHDV